MRLLLARALSRVSGVAGFLSPLGRGLAAFGVLAFGAGWYFHWHEFLQLAAVAGGLLAVGALWQLLPGRPQTEVRVPEPRITTGSAPGVVRVCVQAGAAPMLFGSLVVPVGAKEEYVRLPALGPFARYEVDVRLPDLPRGVHDVGPLRFEQTDPVGVTARRLVSPSQATIWVAPEVTDLRVATGGMASDLDGSASRQLSMNDLAFHALREYVAGDDLRHVHWRSSAKAGELLVRQFHESRRGHLSILLDGNCDSYADAGDFELAVSIATSIALRSVRDEVDTYFRCGAYVARGRDAVAMTDIACRFSAGSDDYLAHAAEAASHVGGSGVVVQVTGSARDLVDLDTTAALFGAGTDWLVVRADSHQPPLVRDVGALRELRVPDLDALAELTSQGMR